MLPVFVNWGYSDNRQIVLMMTARYYPRGCGNKNRTGSVEHHRVCRQFG